MKILLFLQINEFNKWATSCWLTSIIKNNICFYSDLFQKNRPSALAVVMKFIKRVSFWQKKKKGKKLLFMTWEVVPFLQSAHPQFALYCLSMPSRFLLLLKNKNWWAKREQCDATEHECDKKSIYRVKFYHRRVKHIPQDHRKDWMSLNSLSFTNSVFHIQMIHS